MNKKEFNKYCATVMGYKSCYNEPYPFDVHEYYLSGKFICLVDDYNPYSDLNQLVDVVEVLSLRDEERFINTPLKSGEDIHKQFLEFVISYMIEDNKPKIGLVEKIVDKNYHSFESAILVGNMSETSIAKKTIEMVVDECIAAVLSETYDGGSGSMIAVNDVLDTLRDVKK